VRDFVELPRILRGNVVSFKNSRGEIVKFRRRGDAVIYSLNGKERAPRNCVC
jgi:hypothetical protein